jgi:hypothetical protein
MSEKKEEEEEEEEFTQSTTQKEFQQTTTHPLKAQNRFFFIFLLFDLIHEFYNCFCLLQDYTISVDTRGPALLWDPHDLSISVGVFPHRL